VVAKRMSTIHDLTGRVPRECFEIVRLLRFKDVVEYAQQLGYKVDETDDPEEVFTLVLYGVAYLFFATPARMVVMESLQRSLRKIELEDGEACTWHTGKRKFLGKVALDKLLGTGSYGAAYVASTHIQSMDTDVDFVLKFTGIDKSVYRVLKSGWKPTKPWYLPSALRELMMHYFVNHLITRGICPNFVLMVDWFLCSRCDNLYVKKKVVGGKWEQVKVPDKPCVIYALERVDGDCLKLLREVVPTEKWSNTKKNSIYKVLTFQVLYALAVLQKYYGVDHSDAGMRNVFWKRILDYDSSPPTYWTYVYNGVEYYIPNHGYMFFLADYGLSTSNRIFGITRSIAKREQRICAIRDDPKRPGTYFERRWDEDDGITYTLPPGSTKKDLKPFYNPDRFTNRDKGFAIFAKEAPLLRSSEMNSTIVPYLSSVIRDMTGKTPAEALAAREHIPPVDYSIILNDLFDEYRQPPVGGIDIGRYSTDVPFDHSIDELYLDYLHQIY